LLLFFCHSRHPSPTWPRRIFFSAHSRNTLNAARGPAQRGLPAPRPWAGLDRIDCRRSQHLGPPSQTGLTCHPQLRASVRTFGRPPGPIWRFHTARARFDIGKSQDYVVFPQCLIPANVPIPFPITSKRPPRPPTLATFKTALNSFHINRHFWCPPQLPRPANLPRVRAGFSRITIPGVLDNDNR